MSEPPSISDSDSDSDLFDRGIDFPSHDPRPSGEAGGHTVQDWEQAQSQRATLSDALERRHLAPAADHESIDEPSPPTVPLYLRSAATTVLGEAPAETPEATVETPGIDARTRIVTAQSAAIVDAITKGLAEALASSLRPVVASTVVTLLPMMLSLGSLPEDKWPDAARPTGKAAPTRP